MNRHQRRTAAKSAKIAPGPRATTPAALCEFGFKLLHAGQVAEAEGCSRQALTQQPDHADALHLMGIVAFHKQQYDHAVEWIAGSSTVMTQVMWRRIAHHFAVMLAMSGTNEHDDIQFFHTSTR